MSMLLLTVTVVVLHTRTLTYAENLSQGTICSKSKQCMSHNCIKVCDTSVNELVCGASKLKRGASNLISDCYDKENKRTKYIDYVESWHERTDTKKEIKKMYAGMSCSNPKQCMSQNCIKVCNTSTNERVCGASKWKRGASKMISDCYDNEIKRTKYIDFITTVESWNGRINVKDNVTIQLVKHKDIDGNRLNDGSKTGGAEKNVRVDPTALINSDSQNHIQKELLSYISNILLYALVVILFFVLFTIGSK